MAKGCAHCEEVIKYPKIQLCILDPKIGYIYHAFCNKEHLLAWINAYPLRLEDIPDYVPPPAVSELNIPEIVHKEPRRASATPRTKKETVQEGEDEIVFTPRKLEQYVREHKEGVIAACSGCGYEYTEELSECPECGTLWEGG